MKRKCTLKNSIHLFTMTFALLFFLSMMTGCGQSDSEKTEITVLHGWGSTEADHVAMREIYLDFEKDNPDIDVNLVSMPSSEDVIHKVQEMLTVGELPDVIFTGALGEDSIYDFMVDKGYAVNLQPYLEQDPTFAKDIAPATRKRWMTEDGRIYTVSDVLLLAGYWYNTDIFQKAGIENPPSTWDELLEDCKKIQTFSDQNGDSISAMEMDENHIMYLTDALLSSLDPRQLKALQRGEAELNDDAFQESENYIKQISAYSDNQTDFSYRDTLEAFNAGKTAIYINGLWADTMINENIQVKYASFPSSDGAGISCESSCLGYILGNTNNQKTIDASVRFLKYMLSDQVQERILNETGQIPSNPNLDIVSMTSSDRLLQAFPSVEQAGQKIEIPVNIWKEDQKRSYLEDVRSILENNALK
ncbi:MAG: ABC transporter substrate-binding protein [Bilifractor sp.]